MDEVPLASYTHTHTHTQRHTQTHRSRRCIHVYLRTTTRATKEGKSRSSCFAKKSVWRRSSHLVRIFSNKRRGICPGITYTACWTGSTAAWTRSSRATGGPSAPPSSRPSSGSARAWWSSSSPCWRSAWRWGRSTWPGSSGRWGRSAPGRRRTVWGRTCCWSPSAWLLGWRSGSSSPPRLWFICWTHATSWPWSRWGWHCVFLSCYHVINAYFINSNFPKHTERVEWWSWSTMRCPTWCRWHWFNQCDLSWAHNTICILQPVLPEVLSLLQLHINRLFTRAPHSRTLSYKRFQSSFFLSSSPAQTGVHIKTWLYNLWFFLWLEEEVPQRSSCIYNCTEFNDSPVENADGCLWFCCLVFSLVSPQVALNVWPMCSAAVRRHSTCVFDTLCLPRPSRCTVEHAMLHVTANCALFNVSDRTHEIWGTRNIDII